MIVRHILSFGAGVNSVALMVWMLQSGKQLDEVVFSDTGGELPETYDYLPIVDDYLSQHGVPFRIIKAQVRGRDLYHTCWERKVFPSAIWRWSTRDFKVRPIHSYYRSLNTHINQYLAITYDEFERMKTSRVDYVTNVYPLVDERLTRSDCVELIRQANLPIPEKSGCYFCPFNSLDRWQWLADTHPDLYNKAVALEENSKHFPSQRLTDQVFRNRAKITLRELPAHIVGEPGVTLEAMPTPCGAECLT